MFVPQTRHNVPRCATKLRIHTGSLLRASHSPTARDNKLLITDWVCVTFVDLGEYKEQEEAHGDE
jgi:hypothetical protein